MSNLAQAIQLAKEAHAGQVRKYNGEPYINHPIRVMNAVALDDKFGGDEETLIAAVLHDVLEDCPGVMTSFGAVGIQLVYDKFDISVGSIVHELTNRFTKEYYPDLNRRRRKELEFKRLAGISDLGKVIKLYDRIDNLRDFFNLHPTTLEPYVVSDPEMRGFGKTYARESWELMMAIWDDPSRAHISTQLATLAARLRDACKP